MKYTKAFIKKNRIWIGIALLTVLLNVLSWNSTVFSDFYIENIFPIWVNTYGRMTGIFPFSVGEWLIVIGVLLVAVAILLLVAAGIVGIVSLIKRKRFAKWSGFLKSFYGFFGKVFVSVCLIMTLNCFILYQGSTFAEKNFGKEDFTYHLEEVLKVRNFVAGKCNELCENVERDQEGSIVYSGSLLQKGETGDMRAKAVEVMQKLGETYEQLDGYYPRPKPLLSSDFMCQQYMSGYYFPFSMEANYNDVMYIMNYPATMCHELAHLRGFILEDEANFISYLACIQSEDVYFQYSGYLSVLGYLENDLYKASKKNPEAFQEAALQVPPIAIASWVYEDDIFVTDEEWDRINKKAVLDTEVVDAVSDAFVDTNLKLNGVSDGRLSYSRVVELLLQYYE